MKKAPIIYLIHRCTPFLMGHEQAPVPVQYFLDPVQAQKVAQTMAARALADYGDDELHIQRKDYEWTTNFVIQDAHLQPVEWFSVRSASLASELEAG